MDASAERYWTLRLDRCRGALEKNGFAAFLAKDTADAKRLVLDGVLPETGATSVSWGDSLTLHATGILEVVRANPELRLIETFAEGVPREEIIERRRQALLTDLFLTGANAVTDTGTLVNLDMVGNRVAGITFGPKHVVILAGRNKVVSDLEAAMGRIRGYAAPANVIRHPKFKTPCAATGICEDCRSPDRICNTWTITQKSYPKGRIRVILINQDLGL